MFWLEQTPGESTNWQRISGFSRLDAASAQAETLSIGYVVRVVDDAGSIIVVWNEGAIVFVSQPGATQ
jgi:hypothetical protein